MPAPDKRCSRCERALPVSAFCRHARSSDGLRSRCRDCEGRSRRTTPHPSEVPAGSKFCPGCSQVLALGMFGGHAGTCSGYRSHCRSCVGAAYDASPCVETSRVLRLEEKVHRRLRAGLALAMGCKACVKCGDVQPLEAFWKRDDRLDGRSSECARCSGVRRNAPDPEDVERVERWGLADREFEQMIEEVRRE